MYHTFSLPWSKFFGDFPWILCPTTIFSAPTAQKVRAAVVVQWCALLVAVVARESCPAVVFFDTVESLSVLSFLLFAVALVALVSLVLWHPAPSFFVQLEQCCPPKNH